MSSLNLEKNPNKESEYPLWTYGDGTNRKLNEKLYILSFIERYQVRCINNKLYSPDGAIEENPADVEAMLQAGFGGGVIFSEVE